MSVKLEPLNLNSTCIILEDNGVAAPIAVDDKFWEQVEQRLGDFSGKRLISCFTFDQDWDSWEMHPAGDEVVCLLSGEVELILERNRELSTIHLDTPGSFVIVPCGTWHTAKVRSPSSMLFVTPGEGTQNKVVSTPLELLTLSLRDCNR